MQTKKIVVGTSTFGKASDAPIRLLKENGYEVVLNPYGRKLTKEETREFIKGAAGILAGLEPLDREVLTEAAGNLKAVARIGIGMDNVDQEAAAELGIKVSNTPDAPTQAVAEMCLAAALALSRGLVSSSNMLHSGKWQKNMGFSLSGAKALIIGYGRIGQAVAREFKNLGAEIMIYDPARPDVSVPSLDEALKQAQVISLHASGTSQILGKRELDMLPDGAILLNSARGGLADEAAICEALDSGKLAGCWLDVFSEEPYNGPLQEKANAILTPHISTYSSLCRRNMELEATQNILRDLEQN